MLKYPVFWMIIFSFSLGLSTICHGKPEESLPPPARLVILKAQQLMAVKKFQDAAGVLEKFQAKAKKIKPGEVDSRGYGHSLVYFTLGNCRLMMEKHQEAERCYRTAVTKNPGLHAGWKNLAKCCYDIQAYDKAAQAFLKSYEVNPEKEAATLYFGGACYLAAGESKKAVNVFKRLLTKHPAEVRLEWKETFAQACLACDQYLEALPFVEELSEKTSGKKRGQWQEMRLQLYLSLDMNQKALRYVSRLIREDPLKPKWWRGLAHLHLKENRYESALTALIIKGFLVPLSEREQKTIADLYMAVDIPVQAVLFYKRIAGKVPEPDMAYRIARGYFRQRRFEEAVEWVEQGLKKKKSPRLLLLKGDLLYELEKFAEAAVAFETAARQKASPGRAWLMAGYAALNAGSPEKARLAFKKASKYPKQTRAALKALRQSQI
jgi:tetratricopeptide (TPR) repeat protein